MPTLSGNKLAIQTALAVFVLLFAFQGTAPAARLAGNAQPVSTTSTEISSPAKDDAAVADEPPAPAPKKKAPAKKKATPKAASKNVAQAPARQTPGER